VKGFLPCRFGQVSKRPEIGCCSRNIKARGKRYWLARVGYFGRNKAVKTRFNRIGNFVQTSRTFPDFELAPLSCQRSARGLHGSIHQILIGLRNLRNHAAVCRIQVGKFPLPAHELSADVIQDGFQRQNPDAS
jgi:hypothetical protein